MVVTVVGFKGGVGKTTSAVHIAAYLQQKAPTMLIDGDPNRSATAWAKGGKLPFRVVDERVAAKYARDYEHYVLDTQARPGKDDLQTLAQSCDLLVVPTTPDPLSLDALMQTVSELKSLGTKSYRVLLTVVPPPPSRDGEDARNLLMSLELPVFANNIRRLVAFQRAVLYGVPVYAVNEPRAKEGWQDYEQVGKEILP
jgi:chromosome partitioning protein